MKEEYPFDLTRMPMYIIIKTYVKNVLETRSQ